ncbi:aldo/keto reductase [Acetivibrio cellulolyticus]|uniref:aldo/keto reductase n=1 Tax=Acetivibrio cellulolyticus TaxID=35830 RepID=UPI0001E2E2DA|nr:aldo/keto reductase [Acetivibrio cellulolyticus]
MLYREFGKTGEKVSILGFGLMRLPVIDEDFGRINYDKAIPMVRYAIDQGVNYLDTAWTYHNGNSEAFCAKVLEDGYREKVNVATKLPVWEIKVHEDFYGLLDQQLERLKLETIDFYLLHAFNHGTWENCKAADFGLFLDKAKKSGKIRYAGFSFHDDLDLFKEIVDTYPWDFCQIQLNYMDENYQAGLEGMKYAHERGLGVVIMEPLRGGTLSKREIPKELEDIWNQAEIKRTPAEWALKYLWNKKEIGIVLSGMSEMCQAEENIRIASESEADSLTAEENKLIEQAKQFFLERTVVNCTNCRYCMPCPVGVNIPENFWALNHATQFNDHGKADFWINGWLGQEARPSNCVECGLCESKCPQNIQIRKYLKVVKEKYEKVNP